MKKIILLLVVCCQLSVVSGQSNLSGLLNLDSRISFDRSEKISKDEPQNVIENKKSPLLAGALSFVIPGAGEFYSESYIKSAIFVALEAAAITVGLIYDKKGNDQTNFFQDFANQNWSALRYAEWTLIHLQELNPNLNPNDYQNKVIQNGQVNWAELNKLENDVAGRDGRDGSVTGSYYLTVCQNTASSSITNSLENTRSFIKVGVMQICRWYRMIRLNRNLTPEERNSPTIPKNVAKQMIFTMLPLKL